MKASGCVWPQQLLSWIHLVDFSHSIPHLCCVCVQLEVLNLVLLYMLVGSMPSDCSSKTSPGTSPAHLPRNRPKSMIPKIQLPPRPSTAQQRPSSKHRLSLGKPVSIKEIRSSSVGNAPSKEDQVDSVNNVYCTLNCLLKAYFHFVFCFSFQMK